MEKQKSIAIIGAGPAGTTLACLLAKRGIRCCVFDDNKRPDLLVGESLVSAVVPILRELGIEDQVAKISQRKAGAALRHPNGLRADFLFKDFGQKAPDYSYNIPRPQFDTILRQRAESSGVVFINQRAQLNRVQSSGERELALSAESLKQAGFAPNTHPDLLIDATGRHRLFSRILELPEERGNRDDISYFAHYSGFEAPSHAEGQIVLTVLKEGWSWQIPLKDRVSVGVVIDKKLATAYGKTPEERLEAVINHNPQLQHNGKHRRRISKVVAYANYQMRSQKAHGKGWALLGDALAFTDPMLSPGLYMAMLSAKRLEHHLFLPKHDLATRLKNYAGEMYRWHDAWDETIRYFYDGRLLGLLEAGNKVADNSPKISFQRLMRWHLKRVLSSMVSGVNTTSKYNQKMLFYSCKHLIENPEDINNYQIEPNHQNDIKTNIKQSESELHFSQ